MARHNKYDTCIQCGENYWDCECGGIVECCIGCENGGKCCGI
ncbi:hypothetical protein [Spiroplasma mirum]|nr:MULTISPECIES: hypothetical protein [Spiroplasma]